VSDSVIIAFNPPPTIFTSISGTLNCIPNPVSFFDNSLTGNSNDPISNWHWDFGDGTTSNSQNPNHVYTTAGTYSVNLTVTTDAGCTNNNSSAPIIVNAYPRPVAAFAINLALLNLPYDILVCTNQSTGAISYNWNFGDGNTSIAVNPSYLYTTIGNYEIQLIATSNFGCTDTAYAHVVTDADIVFPNAFTPNANGPSGGTYDPKSIDNDIFFPYTSGVIDFKFQNIGLIEVISVGVQICQHAFYGFIHQLRWTHFIHIIHVYRSIQIRENFDLLGNFKKIFFETRSNANENQTKNRDYDFLFEKFIHF